MKGWIQLHRSLTEHWIWHDNKQAIRWIDLLILASWKKQTVYYRSNSIELKRGQLATSVRALARRWKSNNRVVSQFLKLLEKAEMIECNRQNRQWIIVTIIDYDKTQNVALSDQNAEDFEPFELKTPEEKKAENRDEIKSEKLHIRNLKRHPIKEDNNHNKINHKNDEDDACNKLTLDDFLLEEKVKHACDAYGITRETYKKIAQEIVSEWEYQEESDRSYKHFMNTLRIKVNILQQTTKRNERSRNNKKSDRAGGRVPNPLSRAKVHRATTED